MSTPRAVDIMAAMAFLAAERCWTEEKVRRVSMLAVYADSRRQPLRRLGPKSRSTSLKRRASK